MLKEEKELGGSRRGRGWGEQVDEGKGEGEKEMSRTWKA